MTVGIHLRKYNQQTEPISNVRNRKSLLNTLKVLRIILQFMGVVPIMGTSRILNRLQQVWCSVTLLLIWAMCGQQIKNMPKSYLAIETGIYYSVMILHMCMPLCVYFISFINGTKLLQIYENIVSIFEQLRICHGYELRTQYTPIYRRLRNEVLFVTFLLFSFHFFFIALNVYNNGFTMYVFEIFCAFHLPNILSGANLCLYLLTLRVIAHANSYLNTILKSLKYNYSITPNSSGVDISNLSVSLWYKREFCTFNSKKSFKSNNIFITLTEISSNLDELMREVVDVFRIALLLTFVSSFMFVGIQCFLVYKHFDSSDSGNILKLIFKLAHLLRYTFNIISVLWSNNAVIEEKYKTIYILNSFPMKAFDMERNISRFLLQFMARKHTVSVCDIFDLDLTFLLSIISAASTYVILFAQINLGSVASVHKTATTNAS